MEEERKVARLNGKLSMLAYKVYNRNKALELQIRDNKSIPKYIKEHIQEMIKSSEQFIHK